MSLNNFKLLNEYTVKIKPQLKAIESDLFRGESIMSYELVTLKHKIGAFSYKKVQELKDKLSAIKVGSYGIGEMDLLIREQLDADPKDFGFTKYVHIFNDVLHKVGIASSLKDSSRHILVSEILSAVQDNYPKMVAYGINTSDPKMLKAIKMLNKNISLPKIKVNENNITTLVGGITNLETIALYYIRELVFETDLHNFKDFKTAYDIASLPENPHKKSQLTRTLISYLRELNAPLRA